MITSFIFIVFLCTGGCKSGLVPLSFRMEDAELGDSSILKNEPTDKFPPDEAEILDPGLPEAENNSVLELLNSEEKNTTILDISNTNASNVSMDFASEEKLAAELNLESEEILAISDLIEEEIELISEIISKGNSSTKEFLDALQENEPLDGKTGESIKLDELTGANSSAFHDLKKEIISDFSKITEKILDTLEQNETFAIPDVNGTRSIDSPQPQPSSNGTLIIEVSPTDTKNITEEFEPNSLTSENSESQPLSNNTKVNENALTEAENITEFKSNSLVSENLEETVDPVKSTEGILAGFEFLVNSEVARNAAKAMEVFNFSDSLTDHIMEENEFHSFLPAFNVEQDLNSPSQTDLNTEISIDSNIGELNINQTGLNASLLSIEENSATLHDSGSLKINETSSISLSLTNPVNATIETNSLNFTDNIDRNEASEIASMLENPKEKIEFSPEGTIIEHNVNGSISNSSSVAVPECPPPGFCFFWFFSQDTCAVNKHCLGSRICCKIGCSKTCIEVES